MSFELSEIVGSLARSVAETESVRGVPDRRIVAAARMAHWPVVRPVGTTERRGSRILRGRPSTVKAACGVPSGLRYAQALTVEPLRPLRSEERAG
jgi:hypothetical protein